MLKIHHLNMSRSERVVWLVEELGLPYELIHHQRDPQTFRSPASLWAVSPQGKSPVIQDGDCTVCESGAVVEYLIERHGGGRLRPRSDAPEFPAYLQWMHAAEATLMVPILFDLLGGMLQVNSAAYTAFMDGEYQTTLRHLDTTLSRQPYVAGNELSGADIMVSYDLHLANGTSAPAFKTSAPIHSFEHISAYLQRVEARPAYRRMREICP
jgi:glutathione S-transferase